MSRRTKIIIAAAIALALLLLISFIIWFFSRPKPEPVTQFDPPAELEVVNEPVPIAPDNSFVVSVDRNQIIDVVEEPEEPVVTIEPELSGEKNLRRIAAAFAERFGSFSNQADFENLTELKAFMTRKMGAWADTFIIDARLAAEAEGESDYVGTTTRSLSANILFFSESRGIAEVNVNTQRQAHENETLAPRIYYQKLELTFVMESGEWKVDSAYWEEQ